MEPGRLGLSRALGRDLSAGNPLVVRFGSPAAALVNRQDATVQVWLARTDGFGDELPATAVALLSHDERERLAGIGHRSTRLAFGAGRALARRALSSLAPVAPEAWRFALTALGQPVIAGPDGGCDLRFSLAHAGGLVGLAMARGRAVGLDIEPETQAVEVLAVARDSFTAEEVTALAGLDPKHHRDRFLDLWTVKEAYVKARGLGATLPFDRFGFQFGPDRSLHFRPEPGGGSDWRFLVAATGSRHRIAIAAEGTTMAVHVREATLSDA